ncbi:HAD-IA family hydrolase [Paucibacter sp. R3-3]|uniref:phosphoglycolate phosphatase n=1 Tax=Roseateles agri TaxID=3098619 RepID=A0ABU5DPH5_9BURK|nr:HAD-IA family hydrolase [Paucibacter sp. R3-3]MDY0746952.1 HAD-IA family hydrolase [Paucibacter sp. R3-3]
MCRIAAITFDLDGTLLDSAHGVMVALNIALADEGLPQFDGPTVRGWIGDGPDATIRQALKACGNPAVDPLRMRRRFDAATLASPRDQGRAYEGIPELLRKLAGRYPMAVVTNKPTPLARAVLDAAGLLGWFAAVHGADTPEQRKPAPWLLQHAAARLGLTPPSLLMVGDGDADLKAAAAAGCRAAWVSWGYGAAPADPTVGRLDAPLQLLAHLQTIHQELQGDSSCPPEADRPSPSSSSRSAVATLRQPAT